MLLREVFELVTAAGCTWCRRYWAVPCLFILTVKIQGYRVMLALCARCVCVHGVSLPWGQEQVSTGGALVICRKSSWWQPARWPLQNVSPAEGCGAKICCSFARLGLSPEKHVLSRRILMQYPVVNVIVFLMLYFEGEAFAECNLGQSLEEANKKKRNGKW